ncbi:MAG: hypothetical protein ACRDMY_03365 [Gaiellaceae bacterium]
MSFGDFTGVFSRDFVVGFFLPAYAGLFSLWLLASSEFVPNALEQHSRATQLLILGGFAVVVGLALSALSYSVARLFEGYPLERRSRWPVVRSIYRGAIALQRRRYDPLVSTRDDKRKPDKDRQRAAWVLDRYFPHSHERLLPTRLGNAIRAFEQHSNVRWGLDSVTIWPRIEALLSAEEREILVDSKVNFNLFLNAAVGALAVGACLVVDQALNAPQPALFWLLYAIPFALAYILYRSAVDPATEWGDAVRSSIDLHRLELYEKLGVRAPTSFSDERQLALRVNQTLLYGLLLSDDLWRSEKADDVDAEGMNESRLRRWLGIARRDERAM